MVLTRTKFFLVLSIALLGPFYVPRLLWLAHTRATTGKVWFIGHTLELLGDISSHRVILFKAGGDSFFFNAGGHHFNVGDPVPVRYNKTRPVDAMVGRFDPLIPWEARVRIGIKPFIKIIPNGSDAKN